MTDRKLVVVESVYKSRIEGRNIKDIKDFHKVKNIIPQAHRQTILILDHYLNPRLNHAEDECGCGYFEKW